MSEEKESFTYEKQRTIQAAKELYYDLIYIELLRNAKSNYELSRIMATARNAR